MAELMLGLAMLFFAANTLGFDARSTGVSPTPPPNWQATIEANEKALSAISATATESALSDEDTIPVAVMQLTFTAIENAQRSVEATAAAYATQAARPTATVAPTATLVPTSTPLPTPTPLPSTSTPIPTPTPDIALATANADLESRLATIVAMPVTPTPPTPTPDTCIETVNLDEIEIEISAAEWSNADTEQREAILRAHFDPYRDRRIGLSLTFGNHESAGPAKQLAVEANSLLRATLPGMVDGGSILKDYIDRTGEKDNGSVTFLVYFMKDACV